jgi:hypothetical protein
VRGRERERETHSSTRALAMNESTMRLLGVVVISKPLDGRRYEERKKRGRTHG